MRGVSRVGRELARWKKVRVDRDACRGAEDEMVVADVEVWRRTEGCLEIESPVLWSSQLPATGDEMNRDEYALTCVKLIGVTRLGSASRARYTTRTDPRSTCFATSGLETTGSVAGSTSAKSTSTRTVPGNPFELCGSVAVNSAFE